MIVNLELTLLPLNFIKFWALKLCGDVRLGFL